MMSGWLFCIAPPSIQPPSSSSPAPPSPTCYLYDPLLPSPVNRLCQHIAVIRKASICAKIGDFQSSFKATSRTSTRYSLSLTPFQKRTHKVVDKRCLSVCANWVQIDPLILDPRRIPLSSLRVQISNNAAPWKLSQLSD